MEFAAPPFLQPLLARPVAILGAGVSGAGVRALLAAVGATGIGYDKNGEEFTAAAARHHGLLVFSPGFPPDHPWLACARLAGVACWSELDFAALFWRGPLVAITGTNGKTTLTEFLNHALRSVGVDAHATGNIGYPFSRLAAELRGGNAATVAICEVSSFQAETLRQFQPDAVLWTNFAEDHLERHGDLGRYFAAKWKLVERIKPAGIVLAGTSVQKFAHVFGRRLPEAAAIGSEGQPADPQLAGSVFADYPQRENFVLAAAWWRSARFPAAALYAAAHTFPLGRHRLSRVAEIDGVTYWNDSKATNFHAVEAALAGFVSPVALILGGRPKGGDVAAFVERIGRRIKHAFLLGEAGAELAAHCATQGISHTRCDSLAESVGRAAEFCGPGDQVLLSPGFASFDMFRSYADRGDQFEQLVRGLQSSAARLG
ncbi:MAG: hypothetical protein RIQ93_2186 [Verrucomicrobiota bacterium]|jgi:UDP-N-acetylmuramoylalanine--D-glutamate ligase